MVGDFFIYNNHKLKIKKMKWTRRGKEIDGELHDYLGTIFDKEMEKGHKLTVCIGTDSQRHGGVFKFATAIVIKVRTEDGLGKGAMVIGATHTERQKMSLKERMIREVYKSIEVAYDICPILDLYDIDLEVHADINSNPEHASNAALKEAVGYIQGMGYGFKVKPDAWASSSAADNMC